MDILYSPRAEPRPVPIPVDDGSPFPTRQAGQIQVTCLTVESGSSDNTGPTKSVGLLRGVEPLEMVKLWIVVYEVRKMVMLWKRVGDVDVELELERGSWPSPDTSIATWRVSLFSYISTMDYLYNLWRILVWGKG